MFRRMMIGMTAALLLCGQTPKPDVWAPLRFLAGTWTGEASGRPGVGSSERTYEFVLGGRYLQVRNRSVFPPQARNPKGEVHEDWGMVSWDAGRKRFVYRQFHGEGFVNQYVLEPEAAEGALVFVSEAIENIPAGWRARETYRVAGADEFAEVFELAGPGKDFEVYEEQRFRRAGAKSAR